jgi:hypothetical protein
LLEDRPSETLDQVRAQLGAALDEWLRWLSALPTFVAGDGYIMVHAGIAPGKRPEQCTRAELTELRMVEGKPWFDFWRGRKPSSSDTGPRAARWTCRSARDWIRAACTVGSSQGCGGHVSSGSPSRPIAAGSRATAREAPRSPGVVRRGNA